jgi:hypothetical protein
MSKYVWNGKESYTENIGLAYCMLQSSIRKYRQQHTRTVLQRVAEFVPNIVAEP